MEHLKRYQDYNALREGVIPDTFLYNKEHNCLKVSDYYLFFNEGAVLREGDERVNELFGLSLSSLIPSTTSEWVHLGVDGVSAIADTIPGVGNTVSAVIDICHAVSYFIEADHKPEEADSLRVNGVITLIFSSVPYVGNIGSMALKGLLKASKTVAGGIFSILFMKAKLTRTVVTAIGKWLMNLTGLKTMVGKLFTKASDSTVFKMLMKVPIVKNIINYFRNNLDNALTKTGKHLAKDYKVFLKSVEHSMQGTYKNAYAALPKDTKRLMPEKSFIEMQQGMLNQTLHGTNKGQGKAFFVAEGNNYKAALDAKVQANTTAIVGAYSNAQRENAEFLSKVFTKGAFSGVKSRFYKEQMDEVAVKELKNGFVAGKSAGDIKLNKTKMFKEVEETFAKRFAKKSLGNIASKSGVIAAKNATNDIRIGGSDDVTQDSDFYGNNTYGGGSHGTEPVSYTGTDINDIKVGNTTEKEMSVEETKSFMNANNLTTHKVEDIASMGITKIEFHTPDKKGENGKLILGGGVYTERDLSKEMALYTDETMLLNDLKMIKDKVNKERVRPGEMKKWEKSATMSTPFITDKGVYYKFYFIIRERSVVSFAKKTIDQEIEWDKVLTRENISNGFYKFSNSLYIKLNPAV